MVDVTHAMDDVMGSPPLDVRAGQHDATMAELWLEHRTSLVRLAAVLLDDVGQAEDVVQEAYIRACAKPRTLRDPQAALGYLRRTVVNLARSSLRRRRLAIRHSPTLTARTDDVVTADDATRIVERDAVVRAIRALPRRMREAVTLRYYLDLTEAQAAAVMGVSVGSVKAYTSRGLAQLASDLEGVR